MFCLDLILLFKLISRVPDAIGALGDIVENHIHQTGLNAIEKISEIALTVNLHLIIYSFSFVSFLFLESEHLYRNYFGYLQEIRETRTTCF